MKCTGYCILKILNVQMARAFSTRAAHQLTFYAGAIFVAEEKIVPVKAIA